jgi:triacylglycerol esterase/lipase EstA (alpha/beta hydrolase family)
VNRVLYTLIVSALLYFLLATTTNHAQADADTVSVDYFDGDSERCVILLHGLARTSSSMSELGNALNEEGYGVALVDYPSRIHSIEILSKLAIDTGVESCMKNGNTRLYFVTHSLGGILVRAYLDKRVIPGLERIVMLAPPNHGSAVVDSVKNVPGVVWLNGPAFLELGTDEQSVPLSLGKIKSNTAVIAGTRSVNLLLSNFLENPDDGKVSVESARLDGMCAMLVIAVSHPFIMKDELAIEQTVSYLNTGRFSEDSAEYLNCEAREVQARKHAK